MSTVYRPTDSRQAYLDLLLERRMAESRLREMERGITAFRQRLAAEDSQWLEEHDRRLSDPERHRTSERLCDLVRRVRERRAKQA